MTPKQRAKIYRKAAEIFMKRPNDGLAGCDVLAFATKLPNYLHLRLDDFPEFLLFKPSEYVNFWWSRPSENIASDETARILALLLCEQIALSTPS